MIYEDFKDLLGGAALENVLSDKAFNEAKNPKYGPYGLASMIYKVFDERSFGAGVTHVNKSTINSKIIPMQKLGEELHNPVYTKFERQKVSFSF